MKYPSKISSFVMSSGLPGNGVFIHSFIERIPTKISYTPKHIILRRRPHLSAPGPHAKQSKEEAAESAVIQPIGRHFCCSDVVDVAVYALLLIDWVRESERSKRRSAALLNSMLQVSCMPCSGARASVWRVTHLALHKRWKGYTRALCEFSRVSQGREFSSLWRAAVNAGRRWGAHETYANWRANVAVETSNALCVRWGWAC